MLGAIMARGAARGIGFSYLLSTGNEADLAAGEIVDLLVDRPEVDAILLFLEAIRDADRLAQAARRAHAVGKPIIAFKLGRSPFGAELATSHTGALAGSDAACDAFFRAHGIARDAHALCEHHAKSRLRRRIPGSGGLFQKSHSFRAAHRLLRLYRLSSQG